MTRLLTTYPLILLACGCLFLATAPAEALKILMYQTAFSPSHLRFSGGLVKHLVDRGHTVDKIIMMYNPYVTSNGSSLLRKVWKVNTPQESPFLQLPHMTNPFAGGRFQMGNPNIVASLQQLCLALINDSALLQQLRDEQYDIYLVAAYEGCGYGLFELLRIPSMVGYTATAGMPGLYRALGIPEPPSYSINHMDAESSGDNLGFWARHENLYTAVENSLFSTQFNVEQGVFDMVYGTSFPRLSTLASRITYVFLNTNELVDLTKPISPKVKYIGGISMQPPNPVPRELDAMLATAKRGVIVLSFGSLVKSSQVPHTMNLEFFKAFARFPEYTVIWKYDDEIVGGPYEHLFANATNIYTIKWLPQVELLNDGRVSVFITHGGMNSYLETAYAGVPAILIPVLVDQYYNAGCAERLGMGIRLDKTQITADVLVNALHTILDNDPHGSPSTYMQRAKEVGRMWKRRPEDPKRVFVEHLEYAAEFPALGTDVLQLASAAMPMWKYYCLDVLAMWAVGVLVVAALFIRMLPMLQQTVVWVLSGEWILQAEEKPRRNGKHLLKKKDHSHSDKRAGGGKVKMR